MTIHSPKTEHHESHERRVIPIFPELVQPLQDAWDAAPEGATEPAPEPEAEEQNEKPKPQGRGKRGRK